jgi:hypothetical protein
MLQAEPFKHMRTSIVNELYITFAKSGSCQINMSTLTKKTVLKKAQARFGAMISSSSDEAGIDIKTAYATRKFLSWPQPLL